MLIIFQKLSSINAIMFYNSNVAMVVVAAIQVVVTAVAALVMDCAGRKLLILSGVSMCLSTAAFAVYFKLSGETHGNSSGLCLFTDLMFSLYHEGIHLKVEKSKNGCVNTHAVSMHSVI
uniref:Major facilitator superfamily (MFS) profile domain-containing protein n=1 Tax=Oncorhynchus mykiss TaxID=8022 RepID=A0A8C7PT07_ONCMY